MNMDIRFTSYEQYFKEKYYTNPIKRSLHLFQTHVHRSISVLQRGVQTPELVFKILQLSFNIFSNFPAFALIKPFKQIFKDLDTLFKFVKGFQSVDGFINFNPAWKMVVLNLSGITLLIINSLVIADRLKLLNLANIKASLTAIPILGVLPYGGILPLALIGLYGMLLLLSVEKKHKFINREKKILDKIDFWKDLTRIKLESQIIKYRQKSLKLRNECGRFQILLDQRKNADQLSEGSNAGSSFKAKIRREEINDIERIIAEKQADMTLVDEKEIQWMGFIYRLRSGLDKIKNPVEAFRKAKQNKWRAKLSGEQRDYKFALIKNTMGLSKQLLTVASVLSGIGETIVPGIGLALGLGRLGISIKAYHSKKALQKIRFSPIRFEDFKPKK